MSAPAQTAKKLLEEDWIGAPIGVNAICAMRGNEFHRPDADFFYHKGAGPMMDMAAYYLNQMVNLFGGVRSVMTMSKITFPERTIKVPPRRGETITVEVPTYVSSNLRFENGVIATFVNSFDIWSTRQPFIEIYGEKGSMTLPDPNRYVGDVMVRRFNGEWKPACRIKPAVNWPIMSTMSFWPWMRQGRSGKRFRLNLRHRFRMDCGQPRKQFSENNLSYMKNSRKKCNLAGIFGSSS